MRTLTALWISVTSLCPLRNRKNLIINKILKDFRGHQLLDFNIP